MTSSWNFVMLIIMCVLIMPCKVWNNVCIMMNSLLAHKQYFVSWLHKSGNKHQHNPLMNTLIHLTTPVHTLFSKYPQWNILCRSNSIFILNQSSLWIVYFDCRSASQIDAFVGWFGWPWDHEFDIKFVSKQLCLQGIVALHGAFIAHLDGQRACLVVGILRH